MNRCPRFFILAALILATVRPQAFSAQAQPQDPSAQAGSPSKSPTPKSSQPAPTASAVRIAYPLPGDWAPELLYGILSSANPAAKLQLERAAFAAGPAIIPQLKAALKDDRTATFAARELAYIGGKRTLPILASLLKDPRNLDLRRFYYGALGEFDDSSTRQILLSQIANSDSEPDRSVTEDAILALTVPTDPNLIPNLKALEAKIHDVVIQSDIENAISIIQIRAAALRSAIGAASGASVGQAIRAYFLPALKPPPTGSQSPGEPPSMPPVSVKIAHVTYTPDGSRALARVLFEIPSSVATYDMVLKIEGGQWKLASVWLRNESERAASPHSD